MGDSFHSSVITSHCIVHLQSCFVHSECVGQGSEVRGRVLCGFGVLQCSDAAWEREESAVCGSTTRCLRGSQQDHGLLPSLTCGSFCSALNSKSLCAVVLRQHVSSHCAGRRETHAGPLWRSQVRIQQVIVGRALISFLFIFWDTGDGLWGALYPTHFFTGKAAEVAAAVTCARIRHL